MTVVDLLDELLTEMIWSKEQTMSTLKIILSLALWRQDVLISLAQAKAVRRY